MAKRGRIVKDSPVQGRLKKSEVRGAAKITFYGKTTDNHGNGKRMKTTSKKKPRDTVVYELRDRRKVVYRGITSDPERREAEHRGEWKQFTKLVVTSRRITREGAEKKEAELLATYRRNHGGKNPTYNQE